MKLVLFSNRYTYAVEVCLWKNVASGTTSSSRDAIGIYTILLGKHLGLFTAGADNSAALDKLDEVLGKIEGKI